jgi:hypothetical protein
MMKQLATLLLGMLLGVIVAPVSHAGAYSALEGKLERCARAVERIATALEKVSQ